MADDMRLRPFLVAAAIAFPALAHAVPAPLPTVFPPLDAPAAPLAGRRLETLAAPIALYPDALLANALAAATTPADIALAARWMQAAEQANLTPGALALAAESRGWAPSVRALVRFPPVLALFAKHPEWTAELGAAVAADPAAVLQAVQALRARAQAAGTLRATATATVVNEGNDIVIDPANPQAIYVPAYDPNCVFGLAPSGTDQPACAGDDAVAYGDPIDIAYDFIPWGYLDWRRLALCRHGVHRGELVGDADWHPPGFHVPHAPAAPRPHARAAPVVQRAPVYRPQVVHAAVHTVHIR